MILRDRDCRVLGAVWALPVLVFGTLFLTGRSLYWLDLTYIHYPWRALTAQMVHGGVIPLWNPYAYLGMPLAAQMQSAVWYPGSLPFYLWSFATATALFHLFHYGLAGMFAFLWLRREHFARSAALAGALVFMGSGILMSRIPFLNHLSTLAYLPAFLLFGNELWLLSAAFVLCFLSGYPLMLAGGILSAFCTSRLLGRYRLQSGTWLLAAAVSAIASACLLLPAIELAVHSHRAAGLVLEDALQFGLAPRDLMQFFGPLLLARGAFSPTAFWWKTCYLGLCAWAAIGMSFLRLGRFRCLGAVAYLMVVVLLLLGGSTPVSLWLWAHLAPLRYVRYPGNLTYLALPLFAALTATGFPRRQWAWPGVALLTAELALYAVASQPTVPRDYFTDAGPLVRELQQIPENHRYLLSPLAQEWHRGFGANFSSASLDLKHRLYGMTNLPYRLPAAANVGEPIMPAASYAFMDFLYSRPGVDGVAPFLPWADIGVLLTRDRLPSKKLDYVGYNLWHVYKLQATPSRALWFSEADGAALPRDLPKEESLPDIRRGVPVTVEQEQADRMLARGRTPGGWVYASQPRLPGWHVWLDGKSVLSEPALGVFQKVRVPLGDWQLQFRYDPPLWRVGLWLTLVSILAAAAYWYNRATTAVIR